MKSKTMSESGDHSIWQWCFGALVSVVAFAFGTIGPWQRENSVEHGAQPRCSLGFSDTPESGLLEHGEDAF